MPGMVALSPIDPAPVQDFRTFDFTNLIKTATGASITSGTWSCVLDASSDVIDPDPALRLVGAPTFTQLTTTQMIGNCIDNCIYDLSATVNISDGRVLVLNGSLSCQSGYGVAAGLPEGAIPFDYNEFISKFPSFAPLPEEQVAGYWDEAGMIFRNDNTSPEQDPTIRREILDLLTAHCALLFAPAPVGMGGGTYASLGGVLTSKSVNGVSVGSSGLFPGMTGTQAWYGLTQYGLKVWKILAAYRTMHYFANPPRFGYAYGPLRGFGAFGLGPYGGNWFT